MDAVRRNKQSVLDFLGQQAQAARETASNVGVPEEQKTIGDIALGSAVNMASQWPKFALFGGAPIAGFGAMSGLEAAGTDASPADIAKATAAGATTGAVFKGSG